MTITDASSNISFYCRAPKVTRQGFYKYLADKNRPWKYQDLADIMRAIASEDECNDTYGRIRMYQALLLKQPEGIRIPGERTVYHILVKKVSTNIDNIRFKSVGSSLHIEFSTDF